MAAAEKEGGEDEKEEGNLTWHIQPLPYALTTNYIYDDLVFFT
ncbi:hypothetical protein ACT7CY_23160 [Bacillus pacificus]